MAQWHVPAISLAINFRGETVFCAGFGMANLEHMVPATDKSVYEIASITKLFTASAVAMLADIGTLSLGAPLGALLEDIPSQWRDITLAQLLSHQSGIVAYTDVPAFWEQTRLDRSPRQLLDLVRDLPLRFEPGERYGYDNTGYILLGLVIEAVSGQRYADFLTTAIFEPLGMSDSRANDYAAIVPRRAAGYEWWDNALQNKEFYSSGNTFSAGCLLSTAADLALWDRTLGALMSERQLAAMWEPYPSSQGNELAAGFSVGMGWFLLTHDGHRVAAHNGSTQGFSSAYVRFLDSELSVILLANSGTLGEPHELAFAAADIYLSDTAGEEPE
jgi:CubicO group peptidase (beta-lactamase class C family)